MIISLVVFYHLFNTKVRYNKTSNSVFFILNICNKFICVLTFVLKIMEKFKDVYKMTSNPLGFCVIISMVNFDGNKKLERSGAVDNVNLIEKTFKYLNFKVKIFTDLKDFEIKLKLNDLMSKDKCDSHDCFVLYIDSHGQQNGFLTSNNQVVEYREIFDIFSNANCEKFIRKPKILLIDCCRGGKMEIQIIIKSKCKFHRGFFH